MLKTLLPLCLLALVAGCTSAPYTGRTQLMFYGESSDLELGEEAWKEVKASQVQSTNKELAATLQRVGTRLAAAANRKDYQWEFVVFDSEEPNAFALPGGKVAVYTGLFPYFANDAELATVVAHEVGHALARHGVERSSQGMVQYAGGFLVETLLGQDWSPAYETTSNLVALLPYSRTQEYEADHVGLILMAKAGYDPAAALTFWGKFRTLSQTGTLQEFLSTHPDGDKRLAELQTLQPEAKKYYEQCTSRQGLGQVYR